MTDAYEAKGYGAIPVDFGEKLGILVVDFQKAFTDPRFRMAGSAHIDAAVERTAALLEVARPRGVIVAACRVIASVGVDYPFVKSGASAFFGTAIAAFFARQRIDTVCVTGCVTSGCVRASVVDAFHYGFRTMLVEDCCGDQELQPHADTLRDVGRRYADIVSADDVLRRIMANAS
jgi:maleamate amidohydrolase